VVVGRGGGGGGGIGGCVHFSLEPRMEERHRASGRGLERGISMNRRNGLDVINVA